MSTRRNRRRRRALPVLVFSATFALIGGFVIDAVSASAQTVKASQQQSQNWAGYVVQSSTGKSFSSVSGSWTQPRATSSSGASSSYSAFWVGLGGASGQSQSLEQVGTSADWVNGKARYSAWYELVPSAEVKLSIAIHPGDRMSGKVTVSGTRVTISLSDQTTGRSVTRSLQMSHPDTSSAEWVAEAPSTALQPGVNQTLPLADFGKVTFTGASATADGHTGSISDPHWSVAQVQIGSAGATGDSAAPGGSFPPAGLAGGSQLSSGASTSNVSGDGSSFSVSYASSTSTSTSSAQPSSGGYGSSGDGPSGYGNPGFGNGGGYGYAGAGAYPF